MMEGAMIAWKNDVIIKYYTTLDFLWLQPQPIQLHIIESMSDINLIYSTITSKKEKCCQTCSLVDFPVFPWQTPGEYRVYTFVHPSCFCSDRESTTCGVSNTLLNTTYFGCKYLVVIFNKHLICYANINRHFFKHCLLYGSPYT